MTYEKDTRQKIIEAGEKAIEQLIEVAKEELFYKTIDKQNYTITLDATEMKNAASTKKMAIIDAFEILSRITTERESLNDTNTRDTSKGGFAEQQAQRRKSRI
jgi:hypothetical protein